MMHLDWHYIDLVTGSRDGMLDVACPECGPSRHTPANRVRKVLRIWREEGFASYSCVRCGAKGWVRRDNSAPRRRAPTLSKREHLTIVANNNTAFALQLWEQAVDPTGTPAELYLSRRGLELPKEAAGDAIRFHQHCPFAGGRTPAMVCLVRNIITDEPQGIHRTALAIDGTKIKINDNDRMSLGHVAGGAIKITPNEDVATCLGIGEGIESVLSLQLTQEFGNSPVWSLVSAGGIKNFPVLPSIECLWIAVDHDSVGVKAAKACASRWRASGKEIFLVKPKAKRVDLNDLVQESAHA